MNKTTMYVGIVMLSMLSVGIAILYAFNGPWQGIFSLFMMMAFIYAVMVMSPSRKHVNHPMRENPDGEQRRINERFPWNETPIE